MPIAFAGAKWRPEVLPSFLAAHGTMVRMAAGVFTLSRAVQLMRTALANRARQEQALAQVEARIRSTGGAAGLST